MIDSCVFPHIHDWMTPLVNAAKAGYLVPIWSPWIIAESNRVLTWLWLKRHGGDTSEKSWRECSEAAKRMFARLTSVFRFVDDRPLGGMRAWKTKPPDEWDTPIWTAAIRSKASFVVTENLSDAPPENEDGLREFEGILFLHPDMLIKLLSIVAESLEGRNLPALPGEAPSQPGVSALGRESEEGSTSSIPPVYHALLAELREKGRL